VLQRAAPRPLTRELYAARLSRQIAASAASSVGRQDRSTSLFTGPYKLRCFVVVTAEYTQRVTTSTEKGNVLEAVVGAIEGYILRTNPGLSEKTFVIESKKVINVGGVHHEIDILVTIDLGKGYKSVFIFECKNWQDPVGKNEVIIFSAKIAAAQAQHGYLVAKSFTKDAYSQAENDRRMTLSLATEHDPLTVERPFGMHFPFQSLKEVELHLMGRGNTGETVSFDIDSCNVRLLGSPINLREYTVTWGNQAAAEDANSFRSERVPEGEYERTAKVQRDFAPGELIADDLDIEHAELSVRYTLTVARPPIISHFEVKMRGRVLTFAPVRFRDDVTVQMRLIQPE